jgi:hypothetical protein
VIIQDDTYADEVMRRTFGVRLSQPSVGIVVLQEGRPAGVVVINDYSQGNAELTGIGERCWTVRVCRDLARYVFLRLGCHRLTARTRPSNAKARRALDRLGFKVEGVARDWFGNEDAVIYGLLRRECRLLRKELAS